MYKFIATEGIVLDMYSCAAGYRTFGIGCVADTPEEKALVRSGLTYPKVRKHLEEEWTKMMNLVERDAPKQYNQQQKAALAMLFLSIGYERFWDKNKNLKLAYKNGAGIPESRWLKQCNYKSTKTGKYVRSENLYRSKKFEVALFKGDVDFIVESTKRFKKDAIQIQKRLQIWSPPSNSTSTSSPLASASLSY